MKNQMEATMRQWNDYKEEYERLSDWLQQTDIIIKATKTCLPANVAEKAKQVQDMKELLTKLESGQDQMDKFNSNAASLLESHVDTYVNNQLMQLNSRYQVQVNLAKDVLRKVEANLENHQQYEENYTKAKAWIENARDVVWACSECTSSNSNREALQTQLAKIQELLKRQEDGQSLVHATINWGEKAVRNTRSDGRDLINTQIRDIQSEWEKWVRKMANAKVSLETSMLQWADYNSSYAQLQQWITEREAKLQQVCEQKGPRFRRGATTASPGLSSLNVGDRKATLRKTDSIVQDIVSFEPMIASVTSKAEDLLHGQPASEISIKYETLSKHAKEIYAKQKEMVKQHQSFIDAGNNFMQWLRLSREKLGKISEPTGDKEFLSNKITQLKVLQSEKDDGHGKLNQALEKADEACRVVDEEDKEIIEEEVGLMQEEFYTYVESLNKTKVLLDGGIVRWTEYEEQYQEATEWLAQTEDLVKSFNKLQDSLQEKKNVLEVFQGHLQTIFDWQRELDRLNMKAQMLLETCADSRISNAITQLTTKYNTLLSVAKEVMRRLEIHYQDLLKQANQQKMSIEDLNDRCEILMECSACSRVRDQTVQIQAAYTNILAQVQDLVSRVQKNLSDHTEFLKVKCEFEEWLKRAHGTVTACTGDGDEATTKDKLETVKLVATRMTEGQHLLNVSEEAFTKALNTTPPDKQDDIRQDVNNLRALWEQLNLILDSTISRLKSALSRWEDYSESKNKLQQWIKEMQNILNKTPDSKGELGEMKTLIERYKHVQGEIDSKKSDVSHLTTEATELSVWTGNKLLLKEARKLQSDYEELSEKCFEIHALLSAEMQEYTDYHQALQDTEKWLLQISFQLMSHNSLYITNREQTQEQISQHEALLEEIREYQSSIDEVNSKGHQQVQRYVATTPEIKNTIEKQLRNVQESYNSLLSTGIQIKNRLLESLAKFQEYEDTLENIMKNLEMWEPQIVTELETPVENLLAASKLLQSVRGIHNKLQGEKTRLAVAIQACEAATASISRPSSPQDTMAQPIPDRELAVRIKLEDLIDQVQGRLESLTSMVNDLDDIKRNKNAIQKWATEKENQLRDLKSRPAKLRPDAAQFELSQLQDLRDAIAEKQAVIRDLEERETSLIPSISYVDIKDQVDRLEKEVNGLMDSKFNTQRVVEGYRAMNQDLNNWMDQLIRKLEALDKGAGMTYGQKVDKVRGISDEFDGNKPSLDALKTRAAEVMQEVGNLDAQQIEEQLKATDRRWNDLQKRIARKAQMLESAKKGFDSTKQEIEQAREWTRGKLALLNADQPMGFDSKEADNKLFGMKSLQKEVDAKQVLIDSFEKRVNNMKPELESSECQELDSSLASLRNEHDELRQTLKDSLNKLSCSSETRKKFESDLEQGQHWLKNKQGEVIETETLPLRAADVQKDMNKYKKLESEIGDFMDNQLTDLKKQGNLLMKDCDGTDKERLKKLIADLEKGVSKLLDKVQEKIISLEHVLEARKDYEKNLDKCRQWLHQAEVSTSSDVKDPSNASTLHEQLAKYEKLGKEAHHMTTTITDTVKQGQALIPQLSEADRLILQEELSSLAQKHGRLAGTIGDKMGQLKGNIEKQQEVSKAMQESMRFVEGIHNDIEALNRPVGSKIEDVQGVLENYEKILDDLKKYKQKLEGLQGQPLANTADLKAMIIQQDDLIAMIEGQISRLRHLLLLQQQFLALVGEITNFIMKYTEIVKEIEKSGRTVEEKIRKYDDVILKIQECEALLASAVDKGQQIAAEGFVADKNAITEQLQSLKQQLQQLRRAVEKKREEHEMTAAEYRKMAEELEIAMDWLQQNEVVIKACPLLERSVYYVKEEMKKHKELESSVQAHLLKIQSIHDSLKHEDCLPTSLSEKLSESKVLLDSLPKALEERANYLSAQLLIREQFAILVNKLKRWTDEARSKVKDIEDRKEDFDNIEKELSDHKTFFASEPDMKELLQNIRQTADKMWPSLKSTEQEGLSHDLEEQNELLNNTLNLARSREAQLEQNVAIWKDYLELLEQCNNLLLHTEVHEEIVATLAGVRCNIQKVEIALKEVEKNQEKIDFLTDKSEDVIKQANESSKNTIKKNVESVKAKWKELVEHLEKQHLDLADLARKWEDFESKWLSFETALVNCEEKAHHADVIIRSLQQGNEIKQTLQSILEETQLLSGELAALTSMANTVLSYLHTNAQPAWEALNTKLDKLGTSHKKLIESLHHKLDKLGKALVKLQQVKEETKQSEERLKSLLLDLQNINVFDADQDKVEKDLKDLKPKIEAAVSSAKSLTVKNRDYFLNLQQLVPSDITQELSTLELLSETVAHAMEERERDAKRARTVRHEYGTDVDELQNWLQHASAKLQDCSVEPQALKEDLIQIQNEIGTIADKLDRATRNGQIIQEKTQNPEEKVLVQDTVTNLTERLQQVRNWLEERKLQIASSLDSWQNFVQLLSAVKAWVEEKNKFLTEPLELSNLTHAKQRCQDYANAVKSCKHVTKQLSDMGKELERIAEVSSVGPLAEKMTEAEEMKSDVESQLMERSALLQETTEEWEQCEKKVKDVRTWIDKSRLNLDSPLNKKKPLRDQLALREKIISDITIQKTKITISIEKLKVHFRAGVCGDSQVTANGEELLLELNKLIGEVKEQMGILEACLAKVDNYQQEIQDLRQKMSEEEQQLRLVSSPTYSPQDREKANSEQNACREHIKGIQAKITALNERIKLLIQRGTPELEPLDT